MKGHAERWVSVSSYLFLSFFLWLILPAAVYGQARLESTNPRGTETGAISVRVRSATGAPIRSPVEIRLSSRGGGLQTRVARDVVQAEFGGLPLGDYVVEASAAGFLPAREEAQLALTGSTTQVFVYLRAESEPALEKPASAPTGDLPPEEWAPTDIDSRPPAVFPDVPCSVETVVQQVGRQVERLASDLGNVNAGEIVEHTQFDRHGKPRLPEIRRYDYMVSIRHIRSDSLAVEEFRNGNYGAESLMGLATTGLAAMALVFHPLDVGDFETTCEGQGVWNGQPVWYLHFTQRADKPSRMRRYTDGKGSHPIPLKGRAWVHANSYQILRVETDLVAPVPAARLEREHMVIEYSPVHFEKRKDTFWLPSSADVYAELRGHRWHRRHQLQNYVHFAVDAHQKIAAPKIPGEEPAQPPAQKPPQSP